MGATGGGPGGGGLGSALQVEVGGFWKKRFFSKVLNKEFPFRFLVKKLNKDLLVKMVVFLTRFLVKEFTGVPC